MSERPHDGAIAADPWLAEIMDRPVFRVSASAEGAAAAEAHAARQARAFYFAKLPTRDVELLGRFVGAGFAVVDVAVTLEHVRDVPCPESLVTVREYRDGDEEAIVAIGGRSFELSRFHLDPLVEPATAHAIKAEWVRNYCRGARGDRLFVATLPGSDRPVGFLAALTTDDRAVADLMAVDASARGAGAGTALVAAFVSAYRSRFSRLVVGTQVANVRSIRLFERMGFSFVRSEYVVHRHVTR
jgi:ribosomal protein S18 acetylase RimI-like enzyme